MLCRICETLIQKHGLNGAETQLKQHPDLWKEMLLKAQTPQMMQTFDQIADALLDCALHFFRDRLENAFGSREYLGISTRQRISKNDSIYQRLDQQFTFEQAMQQTVAMKGATATRNSVQQMLKNWKKQGLVTVFDKKYRKTQSSSH